MKTTGKRGLATGLALGALLLLLPAVCFADRSGSAAGQFLMLGPGGRPAALGNAYTAVADGVNALYWNPAGLGRLDGSELTFMHSQWFQDVAYNYAAFACEAPVLDGHLGANLTLLDYGEINVTQINGQNPVTGLGKTDAGDFELGLGYGRAGELFDWGVNLKYLSEEIAGYQDYALACDLGVLLNVTPDPNLRFGAALLNLGSKLGLQSRGYNLPLTFKVGGVYRLPEPEVMVTADLIIPADDRVAGAVGLEYTLAKMLALRAGYNSEQDAGSGWSVGAGFSPNPDFSVDYAFVPYGDLGDAHRISLDYRFGIFGGRAGSSPPAPARQSEPAAVPEPAPAIPAASAPAARIPPPAAARTENLPAATNRAVPDLLARGMEQHQQRRYDLAAREFIAAYKIEPRNPTVVYHLASTYSAAGSYDHAGEWFGYYTTLAPEDANGFVYWGICLERNGQPDRAAAAWRRALELDPKNQFARSRLAGGRD